MPTFAALPTVRSSSVTGAQRSAALLAIVILAGAVADAAPPADERVFGACSHDASAMCFECPVEDCPPGWRFEPDVICPELDPPCGEGPILGACCDDMSGICVDGVAYVGCADPGYRWTPDILCTDLPVPCGATTNHFYQLDFDLAGEFTAQSSWGALDFIYVGFAEDVQYFNLNVDGRWVLQNMPVVSEEGAGIVHAERFCFDLNVPNGTPVMDLNYGLSLTPDVLAAAPAIAGNAVVMPDLVIAFSGAFGFPVGLLPPPDPIRIGGLVIDIPATHQNFPNQECGRGECGPAALSNSLNWLNGKHNLGMSPSLLTLEAMKGASNWSATGRAVWYYDEGDDPPFWEHKADYCGANGLPITTRTISDIDDVKEELEDGQDVELCGHHHVAAVTGFAELPNGNVALKVVHDTKQGEPGGMKRETIFYDAANGVFVGGTPGFFHGEGYHYFVVECPLDDPPTWYGSSDGLTITRSYPMSDGSLPPTETGGYPLPPWSFGEFWLSSGVSAYPDGVGLQGPNQEGFLDLTMGNEHLAFFVKHVWLRYFVLEKGGTVLVSTENEDECEEENYEEETKSLGANWEVVTITYDIKPQPAWESVQWEFDTDADADAKVRVRNVQFATHCEPDNETVSAFAYDFLIADWAAATLTYPTFGEPMWWWSTPGTEWLEMFGDRPGVVSWLPDGMASAAFPNAAAPDGATEVWLRYDTFGFPGDMQIQLHAVGGTVIEEFRAPMPLGDDWVRWTHTARVEPQPEMLMVELSGPLMLDALNVAMRAAPQPPMLGDLNCDGFATAADIDPFVIALTGGPDAYTAQFPDCNFWHADCNQDGFVTAADIDPFVQILIGSDAAP
jgi:hypothetical protein